MFLNNSCVSKLQSFEVMGLDFGSLPENIGAISRNHTLESILQMDRQGMQQDGTDRYWRATNLIDAI